MKLHPFGILAAAAGVLCLGATARAEVTITDAWARATVVPGGTSAAYAVIHNSGPDRDDLISVSTPIAKTASVHESIDSGGVMRMEPVKDLPIPAHQAVELKPGGYHVMIMQLEQPLKEGGTMDLLFEFKKQGLVKVTAKVAALSAMHMP